MVKDFTLIIVAFIAAVTVITWKALDQGIDGVVLDSSYTFLGTILGAVTLHYYNKHKGKDNISSGPGGD